MAAEAHRVRAPTLILHTRGDAAVPFEAGRHLASLIPGARFVPLRGRNHILREGEPGWDEFVQQVREFLAEDGASAPSSAFAELTPRERAVLEELARGLSNGEIAQALFVTPKTVRNYISRIFAKLDVNSRARAIVMARDAGLGHARRHAATVPEQGQMSRRPAD